MNKRRWINLGYDNGFIITWILHQIIMYSSKVKLVPSKNNDPPIRFPPTGWTNWPINWRQFIPCHNIHVYSTSNILWYIFLTLDCVSIYPYYLSIINSITYQRLAIWYGVQVSINPMIRTPVILTDLILALLIKLFVGCLLPTIKKTILTKKQKFFFSN